MVFCIEVGNSESWKRERASDILPKLLIQSAALHVLVHLLSVLIFYIEPEPIFTMEDFTKSSYRRGQGSTERRIWPLQVLLHPNVCEPL
jgi:hypothetical protein